MAASAPTPAARTAAPVAAQGAGIVLLTLAAAQFLMTLDSSVMNVSIATVADDVGTSITGIQGAITAYTLVMATLMITGGKLGAMYGRKRVFTIGAVIYGAGSLTTSLAPSLPVLLIGWSLLEGIGAALIMPAIVALVAGNFPPERRTAAYGAVAAAGGAAIAVGPLLGGFATTYFSWRWVFAGEVIVVIAILLFAKRVVDAPAEARTRIDYVGVVLSAAGLGAIVFGVLRSSEWGWVSPKPNAPTWLGISPTAWLVVGGLALLYGFLQWEQRMERHGAEPLLRTDILEVRQLQGGLRMFFAQYFVQAGVFFTVPLFLSVALGLSALETGVRILPLSVALLVTAIGIPRVWPAARPRRVVRIGLLAMLAGILVLMSGLDPGADAGIVTIPMLLMGIGVGALSSQLGAITVSAVPDDRSAEVGGVQNTVTNLGISLGTALAGAVLIGALTSAFLTDIADSKAIPNRITEQATTTLAGGVPFISDKDLDKALKEAGVRGPAANDAKAAYSDARLNALRSALFIVAIATVVALFFSGPIPVRPIAGPAP
jgi:EmrB/QacA subfamily drug resistance transporter